MLLKYYLLEGCFHRFDIAVAQPAETFFKRRMRRFFIDNAGNFYHGAEHGGIDDIDTQHLAGYFGGVDGSHRIFYTEFGLYFRRRFPGIDNDPAALFQTGCHVDFTQQAGVEDDDVIRLGNIRP